MGPILQFLAADHERLDALLAAAVTSSGEIDLASYEGFRAGLLRHIAIEEKFLFPAVRRAGPGAEHGVQRLHREHGALALLLVPTPTAALIEEIRSILTGHNEREEGVGGVYESCDRLPAAEVEAALGEMRRYPPVKLAPHFDGPGVARTAAEALRVVSKRTDGFEDIELT